MFGKDQDFGYYGKGTAGYAHYMHDFNRIYGKGFGGGGGGNSGGSGCFTFTVVAGIILYAILEVITALTK